MSSLIDHIERFSRSSKDIYKASQSTASPKPAPFCRAVLESDLGDLARDIDPAELGLFTLSRHTPHETKETKDHKEIGRVEFHGATPLRKPPARDLGTKAKDPEPEVYLYAALKCMDRYHAVKPMYDAQNRAETLLNHLESLRENLHTMSEELRQVESVQAPSLKPEAIAEEQRVQALQAKLQKLEKKKADLLASHKKTPGPPSSPLQEAHHDSIYFGTPGPTTKTFHFSTGDDDNLLEEDVHNGLGDVSTTSFTLEPSLSSQATEDEDTIQLAPTSDPVEEEDTVRQNAVSLEPEPTVAPPSPPPSSSEAPKTKTKLKINHEVERIATKIWACMGDTIKPGHDYDTSGGNPRPPLAKDTIVILQNLAAMTIVPAGQQSPSTLTTTSAVPAIEDKNILTGHLLHSLITTSNHSFPLNQAKEILAQKISADTGAGRGPGIAQGTRIVYACVAKRLLKIERGGGEQVVKFDV